MSDYKIEKDALIRLEPVYTGEGGFRYACMNTIITKEEFLACYNAWVRGEDE